MNIIYYVLSFVYLVEMKRQAFQDACLKTLQLQLQWNTDSKLLSNK